MKYWLLLVALSLPFGAAAQSFPEQVAVGEHSLKRVGQARYSILWKRITDVALYVDRQQAMPDDGDILDPDYRKYLTIEYGLSVSAERFRKMTREQLAEHWSEEVLAANREAIDTFCNWLGAVEAGDRYAVYWLPDSGLTLALNGVAQGTLKDPAGAAVVLSIWLGKAAISESQRDELLAQWQQGR